MKLLLTLIASLLFTFSLLHAEELANDHFTTGFDGWSGSDITAPGDSWLYIPKDKSTTKEYDFGIENADQDISITSRFYATRGWDWWGDYFYIYINDKYVRGYTVGGGTSYVFSVNSKTDSDGKIKVNFRINTSRTDEWAAIDYVKIVTTLPTINTRTFKKVPIGDNINLNIYGSTIAIGNQLLCKNSADGETCEPPSIGATNNSISQHKAKIDPTGPESNSMAKLILNANDKIIWAGLYWSARKYSSSLEHPNAAKIKMKTPSSTVYKEYSSIESKFNWYSSGSVFDYACMQDVTDDVKNAGAGEYYVGGIDASNGSNTFASWTLLVVVENPDRSFKNINVYDGFQAVYNGAGYPSSVDIEAYGFLTPKDESKPVKASLIVYTGESEAGLKDSATLTNDTGTFNLVDAYNDETDIFNASISIGSEHRSDTDGLANPNFQNVIGTDIDKLDVTGLSHFQTDTTITIKSDGDRYTLNMFALETEIYMTKFCYDYAYKQLGTYFTEENDGSKNPRLIGNVNTSEPIEVSIYIKNLDADVEVKDMHVNILDLDDEYIKYKSQSTYLAPIGSLTAYHVDDSLLDTTPPSVKGIPIGNVNTNDHFYFYYQLDPQKSEIDTPIKIQAVYTMSVDGTDIEYPLELGDKIPMCSDQNFHYSPAASIFNVVHNAYYATASETSTTASPQLYNLPTQIVKREPNFKVISLDINSTDTLIGRNTIVAVEMIDAAAFHETNASCQQLSSSISPRVWITLENNATNTMFDKTAIQNAIANGMTSVVMDSSTDFYNTARQSTAFRITYNAADNDNSIIDLDIDPNNPDGKYELINPPADTGTCACSGRLTNTALAACMECIYGMNTRFICSRDNFAIRPEAFMIKINDQDQNNGTQQRLADAVSGVAVVTNEVVDLATGYNYNINISAVDHTSNSPSKGYTMSFGVYDEAKAQYEWSPRNGIDVSGCNDTTDKEMTFKFVNGFIDKNSSVDQVGEYKLSVNDSLWSTVDYNDEYRTHQTSAYYSHEAECIKNDSSSRSTSPYPLYVYPSNDVLNGCDISSDHENKEANIEYNNYDITLHPYQFDVGVVATVGPNNDIPNANSFVYMEDMNITRNMSFHLNGTIQAKGLNDIANSNFVDNCFAKPLDVTINRSNTSGDVDYGYFFESLDTNSSSIRVAADKNVTNTHITLNTSDFIKLSDGAVDTKLNLNFNRVVNTPANPESITYNRYNVNCTNTANCTYNANLTDSATTSGFSDINQTIRYYYGRSHSTRQAYQGNSGIAPITYEVFCNSCDKTQLQNELVNGATSLFSDDPRWFINPSHTATYGSAGAITQTRSRTTVTATTSNGSATDSTTITYDISRGYPYKTTMQHNASGWLIYNANNANASANEFEVEFHGQSSGWSGTSHTTTKTKTDASNRTNRRTMW